MFIDTAKGLFDTDSTVEQLINEFTPTVIDKESFAKHHLLQQTHTDLELSMRNITVNHNKEKSQFILYNTMNFLLDENLPSLEIISQAVILQESSISVRMVEHVSNLDMLKLQSPHSLRSQDLINQENFDPTWTEWSRLAGRAEGK